MSVRNSPSSYHFLHITFFLPKKRRELSENFRLIEEREREREREREESKERVMRLKLK